MNAQKLPDAYGTAVPWDGEREQVPRDMSALRYWFSRQLARRVHLGDDQRLIFPLLVQGDTLAELKENVAAVTASEKALAVPQFYSDLFDLDQAKRSTAPEITGPFEVVLFSDTDEGRALDGVGATRTSMPIVRRIGGQRQSEPDPSRINRPGRHIRRIVAVIDSDIAWAQSRFRDSDGRTTRIAWFWDMNADAFDAGGLIGRHMSWQDIESYLADLDTPGLGEKQLYQRYAADSFVSPTEHLPRAGAGHGTSVLDAAVGGTVLSDDDTTVVAAIELPRAAVGQTNGYFLDLYIRLALDWLRRLADAARVGNGGGPWPEVLANLSVGGSAGRHDGLSPVERALDARLQAGHLAAAFLPAGNGFESRCHARFRGSELASAGDLIWRILPDDGTPSFLEVWMPDDRTRPVSLELELPNGGPRFLFSSTDLDASTAHLIQRDGEPVAALIVVEDGQDTPRPRRLLLIAVRETAIRPARFGSGWIGRPDLAGDWRLSMQPDTLDGDQLIELWIARDDPIFRLDSKARQSFFAEYSPAAARVTTEGTLTDYASGKLTTVIAAHYACDRIMTEYSGQGTLHTDAVGGRGAIPCASHAADLSRSHPGLATAGTFSGSMRRLNGTSVATPRVLREQVLLTPPSGLTVRERVRLQAAADEARCGATPNPLKLRDGAGPLDFGNGRLELRELAFGQKGATNWPSRRRSSACGAQRSER